MDDSSLQTWAVSRSLVLVSQIQRWQDEDAETYRFLPALLKRTAQINEDAWIDALCDIPGNFPVYPLPDGARAAAVAHSPQGAELSRLFCSVAVQDTPRLVVAAINPFAHELLCRALTVAFPEIEARVIYSSPHAVARLHAQIERLESRSSAPPEADAGRWSALLGPGYETLDAADIVDALWAEGFPYIPAYQVTSVAPVPECTGALIVRRTPRRAWFVSANPADPHLRDKILQATGLSAIPMAVTPEEFTRLAAEGSTDSGRDVRCSDGLHVEDWRFEDQDDTGLYHSILAAAIDMGSSDIHLEPKLERARVRFRIDGHLHEQAPLPLATYTALVRNIKIMGGMQQQTVGHLQDGSGWFKHRNERYDLRFAVGVVRGSDGNEESVNIRIFNSRVSSLGDLRMPLQDGRAVDWFLSQGSGMAILSGPTGSGKTTSLYAMLKALSDPGLSLVTIEQPVEKFFPDAKQISVEAVGDLTFPKALSSVVRQDPDVIMVGEIRDPVSASIAIQAALTGHLVLTTLHANDAASILARMEFSFGIDRSTLATAIKLLVAQRLVPQLCPFCKRPRAPRPEDVELFPHVDVADPVICEATGCHACKMTGRLGRALVMETIAVDRVAEGIIASGRPIEELSKYSTRVGYRPLAEQAAELLLTGMISMQSARLFIARPSL